MNEQDTAESHGRPGRKPSGSVVVRQRNGGTTYTIRFQAYGRRHTMTLGTVAEGRTREKAEEELKNVLAERGLRGAVIYRKLSLGSQSEHGERTTERLLSASVTCRLQGRSLFAYLTDALSASIRGDPIPLLA